MSTARASDYARPLPTRSPDRPATDTPVGLTAAEQRGTTTLADKVVEKIAARAALDVTHAAGLSRRLAGRDLGKPTVRAHAQVDGHVASLRLEMAVEYPASARATTRGVREHVSEQLSTLCDLHVDHVDITVAVLRRPDTDRRRVH